MKQAALGVALFVLVSLFMHFSGLFESAAPQGTSDHQTQEPAAVAVRPSGMAGASSADSGGLEKHGGSSFHGSRPLEQHVKASGGEKPGYVSVDGHDVPMDSSEARRQMMQDQITQQQAALTSEQEERAGKEAVLTDGAREAAGQLLAVPSAGQQGPGLSQAASTAGQAAEGSEAAASLEHAVMPGESIEQAAARLTNELAAGDETLAKMKGGGVSAQVISQYQEHLRFIAKVMATTGQGTMSESASGQAPGPTDSATGHPAGGVP